MKLKGLWRKKRKFFKKKLDLKKQKVLALQISSLPPYFLCYVHYSRVVIMKYF